MFEGDLKYRQLNGETMDPEAELQDFKTRQERKQQVALKRAKKDLQELLDEEGLAGDELVAELEAKKDGDDKE